MVWLTSYHVIPKGFGGQVIGSRPVVVSRTDSG